MKLLRVGLLMPGITAILSAAGCGGGKLCLPQHQLIHQNLHPSLYLSHFYCGTSADTVPYCYANYCANSYSNARADCDSASLSAPLPKCMDETRGRL